MKAVCIEGVTATCGDTQGGSSKVFISGNGVCRVGKDKAGDVIEGPGSTKVRIEGYSVSLDGDTIKEHSSNPTHNGKTIAGQSKVFCGS